MTWSDIKSYPLIQYMYYFILVEGVLFFLFHQYLEHVLPSEFNVPISPFFFLKKVSNLSKNEFSLSPIFFSSLSGVQHTLLLSLTILEVTHLYGNKSL